MGTGIPKFVVVGLPDAAVREGRERVRSAIRVTVPDYPIRKELVNLSPAHRRKSGGTFDLAIAMALLAAAGHCDAGLLRTTAFLGELSLDGRLRPVAGALPAALTAARRGIKHMVVPAANGGEAGLASGLRVYTAASLAEALELVHDGFRTPPVEVDPRAVFAAEDARWGVDLAEVRSHHVARRALEIAAAGSHHLFLWGPPGAGKSMLAERLVTILPPMSTNEAVSTTSIHSIAGLARARDAAALITRRPLRCPHHSISVAGMVGGGFNPRPGEVTLAHNGVLFLDELAEFSAQVLNQLREPLESRRLTISRGGSTFTFPADFLLVAAANPCPCGFSQGERGRCSCSQHLIDRYRSRLNGPLLDRIDLHVAVERLAFEDLCDTGPGESSSRVRDRVIRARQFRDTRPSADSGPLAGAVRSLLARAADKMRLSARGIHRVLAVARTIADLAASEQVGPEHLAEALQFRRSPWTGG